MKADGSGAYYADGKKYVKLEKGAVKITVEEEPSHAFSKDYVPNEIINAHNRFKVGNDVLHIHTGKRYIIEAINFDLGRLRLVGIGGPVPLVDYTPLGRDMVVRAANTRRIMKRSEVGYGTAWTTLGVFLPRDICEIDKEIVCITKVGHPGYCYSGRTRYRNRDLTLVDQASIARAKKDGTPYYEYDSKLFHRNTGKRVTIETTNQLVEPGWSIIRGTMIYEVNHNLKIVGHDWHPVSSTEDMEVLYPGLVINGAKAIKKLGPFDWEFKK